MRKFRNEKCEEFFDGYPHHSSASEQVAFLRERVTGNIDPDLYGCISDIHKLGEDGEQYRKLIEDYWGTQHPVYTEITVQDIKNDYSLISINYDSFISFPVSMNHTISHNLSPNFTLKPPCFSLPFLEAIYQMDNQAVLVFTLGKKEGKDSLVFKIKGTTYQFYDFSQIPPITPEKEPCTV